MAFQSLLISKFSGGACPQTPLAARASGARVPPHLYYPCSAVARGGARGARAPPVFFLESKNRPF